MTNSEASRCNASSTGPRLQIPGIQMSSGAKSSPTSAKTPFSFTQNWGMLWAGFSSLFSLYVLGHKVTNGGTRLWLWGT